MLRCRCVFFVYLLVHRLMRSKIKYKYGQPQRRIKFFSSFGPEIWLGVPTAYYFAQRNLLHSTESVSYTKSLYFFSPNHTENPERQRAGEGEGFINLGAEWGEYKNLSQDKRYELFYKNHPDTALFTTGREWSMPDYRSHFSYDFNFNKPILVVRNKYYKEWGRNPLCYWSIEDLKFIFDTFGKDYVIIYDRIDKDEKIVHAQHRYLDIPDYQFIREHYKEVITIKDLLEKYQFRDYLTTQLHAYASSEAIFSVHGGYFPSIFNNKLFVFSHTKIGRPHRHGLGIFEKDYSRTMSNITGVLKNYYACNGPSTFYNQFSGSEAYVYDNKSLLWKKSKRLL